METCALPQSDQIVDINLHFLRKLRGLQALGQFAMQDDGTCLVSVPDDMEVRAFHAARVSAQAAPASLVTYSVETLRKVEIGAPTEPEATPLHIGISDDAVYGFRGSRKTRFLSDRRATFADVSLSSDGQKFALVFSDLLVSGWALALGTLDGTGRLLWTKDLSFTAARVSVDRTGKWIAVGGSDGAVQIWSASRDLAGRGSWPMKITALATIGPERTVFAGLQAGSGVISVMDAQGTRLWQTPVPGVPLEIACDEMGHLIAAVCSPPEQESRLLLFGSDGTPLSEVELGLSSPTGVSVSADGRWIAVSSRDGTLAVFAPQIGARQAEITADDALANAQALANDRRYPDAVAALRTRLNAVPTDATACEALVGVISLWRSQTVDQVHAHQSAEQWPEADSLLAAFLDAVPLDITALRERQQLRRDWADQSFQRGQSALLADDPTEAEHHLNNALIAEPLHLDARRALSAACSAARSQAERQGQADVKAGRFSDAVVHLRRARELGASRPEVARLLWEAQVGQALAEGNRLYQERQYAASAFHFKKVLALAPDHPQAKQRLGYAQSLEQDASISDRFRRLE